MTAHGYDMNDELLVSYLLGEADAGVQQVVEDWIRESDDNARYFSHFRTIWNASAELVLPASVNENAAWQRFVERTKKHKKSGSVFSLFNRTPFLKAAATVLISATLLAMGYFIYDYTDRSQVVLAAVSEPQSKTLPDGSTVTLNKNSTIQYTRKLRGEARTVQLKGEAFFKVTPDKEKPFVIGVNDVTVTVLGTSFNVKGYGDSTEVVVESGTVKVESAGRSVILQAGQRAVVQANDSISSVQANPDKLYNYFVTKEFVCDNTPLWKLVEVLNEAYNVQIEITDAELKSLPLTTTFHNESLDNILNVISETFDITVTRDGERILLNRIN